MNLTKKHGKRVNEEPETMLLDILKPYEQKAKSNSRPVYTSHDNKQQISEFLEQKHDKEIKKEQVELRKICDMKDKTLFGKLRNAYKSMLNRLLKKENSEIER